MIDLNQIRLLLIDDDEDDYIVLRDLIGDIQGPKPKLDWVGNYSEGRAALARGEHDLYLVDYRLGEGSGLDLLREAVAAGATSPIILMTGYGDRHVDMQAMEVGAADYLVKDQITPTLLERAIRYAIYQSRTLKTIREGERNFRDLFNATFEGILIHDRGVILDLNEVAASIFGYPRTTLIGMSIFDLAHANCHTDIASAMQTGTSIAYEITAIRQDGSQIDLEVAGKPHVYQGRQARLVAVRDVTEKKQMGAQILVQDRMASIGLLASSLAHEIGTPLGVIRGRAEMLAYQLKSEPSATRDLDIIISQIDRVSTLIRSLLNLARGSGNHGTELVSLRHVMSLVLDFLSYEFERKGVTLENKLDAEEPLCVVAEADPLQQVILNLLVNGLHAIETAKEKGRKSGHFVRIFAESLGESRVALCVQDSGDGISEANLKNLFKPFFTTKGIGKGTGLGLATSYRIVSGWGGSFQVESKEGQGTTFKLILKAGDPCPTRDSEAART